MTPRLVLLPGLDGTGTLFRPLVTAIGSSARTLVIDYTPEMCRYTECRALVTRLLAADEPFVLVGESFSGPVAISIAATHPPGLCGLALVGSFVSSPRLALNFLSALVAVMPTQNGPGWFTDFLLLGRYATPDLRMRVRDAMACITPDTVRARLREIARVNVGEELSRVRVPVLYLRATEDRLVPAAAARKVIRLAKRSTLIEIPAPHLVLQCEPEQSAKALVDFARACV